MPETKKLEIDYKGRKVPYQTPLGIYLDGQITERIHDDIIPKYHEIIPEELVKLDLEGISTVRRDTERQLQGVAQQDTEEVREALRNTLNLTTLLLQS